MRNVTVGWCRLGGDGFGRVSFGKIRQVRYGPSGRGNVRSGLVRSGRERLGRWGDARLDEAASGAVWSGGAGEVPRGIGRA